MDFVNSLFHLPFPQLWILLLLALARIVPIFSIAPLFGGNLLPAPVRIGFSFGVTLIFLPYLVSITEKVSDIDFIFLLLLAKEILIGSAIGFILSIPYFIAQSAGSLIDQQRGAQSLQVSDPATTASSSPIGNLFGNLFIVIFFAGGGGILFFEIFFLSYQVIPPTQFINPHFFKLDNTFWLTMVGVAQTMMQITLQLSAPALLLLLLSDVFLGVANRMAPQVQVTFLLYSLKAFGAIVILLLGWWFILKQFDVEIFSWLKLLKDIIYSFS